MAQAGSQDRTRFIESLKLRASSLLAFDSNAHTKSVNVVWPSGEGPTVTSSKPEETIWQACLIALGRSVSPSTVTGGHFTKVIEYSYDANKVPFPYQILRHGWPKPLPALVELECGATDTNSREFLLRGVAGADVDTSWSAVEQECGQKWLHGLAAFVSDLRDRLHVDTSGFDTNLTPWPMMPSFCGIASLDDVDASFFESGRYLRDTTHQDPTQLDDSLSDWPLLPANVIRDDTCTEEQLKLLALRSKVSPSRAKAIEKRRVRVDPRFFEEVRPALEKDAALAEMRARWAREKANAVQEHDRAAEYGAQFVAWPHENERCWPKPPRVWLQRVKWFAMWRNSQRAKQEEARKLRAKLGHKKATSSADSDASWEVLSECSDSSWQAVSELSDTSWLELAAECDIVAHMNAKISELSRLKDDCKKDLENALPAYDAAVKAMMCLSKSDIVEVKALKTPPHGIVLVAKAMCYCFAIGPKRHNDSKFDFWGRFKKLIGDAAFLNRLLNYDKDNISEETLVNLLPFESDPSFDPEVIAKASVAGKGLSMWVRAIIAYAKIAKEIAPKRYALKQAEVELESATKEMASRTKKETLICSTEDDDSRPNSASSIEEDIETVLKVAEHSLMTLDKAAIVEIKSMCNPPQLVKVVCACVMILRPLGKEDVALGWKGAKAMLGDANLLRAMQEYKKEAVSDLQVERVRGILNREKQVVEGDAMQNVSKAGYCLLQWVKAVVKYHDASKRTKSKGGQVVCADDENLHSPCSTTTPSTESFIGGDSPRDLSFEQDQASAAISFPVVRVNALRELKSLSKPPSGIDTLLIAIMELQAGINSRVELDEDGSLKHKSWAAAQKLLCDPGQFAQDLKEFEDAARSGRVPDANIENARRIQQTFGDALCPEVVKRKSCAASGLALWLDAALGRSRFGQAL